MLKKIIYILVFVLLAACGQTESDPTAMPEIVATDAPTLEAETAEPVPESESEAAADPTAETGSAAQSNLLAPQGTPRETYNAPFPVAITLDGDTSDWQGVPRVVVPESALVVTGATSVSFAAAADEEYLYLLGDVTDARIISGEHGTDYWNEDSVEFYLNGSGDLGATSYKDGVLQLTIPPFNIGRPPEEVVIGGISNEMADAQVVVVESDDGYIVEIAVPLQNRAWNIQREHGSVIGFQVHLNGATESARNLKAIWSVFDTSDSSYQNPSVFGQLVFFEIGQGDVVANVPEPTPAPTREPIEVKPANLEATLTVEETVE
jgi:hypothetical protein